MTTLNNLYEFNQRNVDATPQEHGVYVLYQNAELIYIGRASGTFVTIRSRLQSHRRGDEGWCTYQATHFRFQVAFYPAMLEENLLREYQTAAGRLPRCNDRIG